MQFREGLEAEQDCEEETRLWITPAEFEGIRADDFKCGIILGFTIGALTVSFCVMLIGFMAS